MNIAVTLFLTLIIFILLILLFYGLFCIEIWSAVALSALIALIFSIVAVTSVDIMSEGLSCSLLVYIFLILFFLVFLFLYIVIQACTRSRC